MCAGVVVLSSLDGNGTGLMAGYFLIRVALVTAGRGRLLRGIFFGKGVLMESHLRSEQRLLVAKSKH